MLAFGVKAFGLLATIDKVHISKKATFASQKEVCYCLPMCDIKEKLLWIMSINSAMVITVHVRMESLTGVATVTKAVRLAQWSTDLFLSSHFDMKKPS